MKTKRKKKLYLVGFDDDWNCVYGKEELKHNYSGPPTLEPFYTDPLTLNQAKERIKKLTWPNDKKDNRAIYKLVRIK